MLARFQRRPKDRVFIMLKRIGLSLLCAFLLLAGLTAQEATIEKKVLKNADIVLMIQNHFDDATLMKIIEVSDSDFDISGDALIDLKNQGASPAVLRAMLSARQKTHPAPRDPAPIAATSPGTPSTSTAAPPSTPQPTALSAEQSDADFATKSSSAVPTSSATRPQASPAPATGFSGISAAGSPRGLNPQQMAAMQAQLSSLGASGLMRNMGGMGAMSGGGFSAGTFSPEQMPHVFLKLGANQGKQEISASTAEIGQSKYKGGMGAGGMALRSLATEGLSFAAVGAGPAGMMAMSVFSMGSGFMPGMRPGAPKMTYVWGLPGRKSSREMSDTNPMFELTYGNIPGVDPDAYEPAVLKLVQSKDNYRLVGATQIKMTTKNMMAGASPENGKWISEDRWPSRVDKEERGFYILHTLSPLEPGEYAVVLRPVKGYKAVSSGLGGHAQVFYSVWDFSVPGEPDSGKKKKKK
jgi:hypothetical protein